MATKTPLLDLLAQGDLRTTGQVDEVVRIVLDNPGDGVRELVDGLTHGQSGVRMRSADALEKATLHHPEWLSLYRNHLVNLLHTAEQQEVQWHLALIIPRLSLSSEEAEPIAQRLLEYFNDSSSAIVRVNALESLTRLALTYPNLQKLAVQTVEQALKDSSPAVAARARRLLHS